MDNPDTDKNRDNRAARPPGPVATWVRTWARTARAPFFTATIVPVILGGAAAWYETGRFNWFLFALVMVGGVLAHAGTNMANDYFDTVSGNDTINQFRSPFNGGSGSIQDGLVAPREELAAALLCYAVGAGIGLYLASLRGWPVVALMLAGGLAGFLYTATPVQLAYRGVGEIFVGLSFGPFLVMGTYYVLSGTISALSVVASVPVGLLIAAVLYINQFPDYEADRAVGKANLVVRLGTKRARWGYYALMLGTYAWIAGAVAWPVAWPAASAAGGPVAWGLPWTGLIALLTLPITAKALRLANLFHDAPRELLPANAMTIMVHLATGVLLALGLVLGRLLALGPVAAAAGLVAAALGLPGAEGGT